MNPATAPSSNRRLLLWAPAAVAGVWMLSRLRGEPEPQVPQVSIAQAKALVDQGVLVLDVRGAEAFAHRHVPGAISVPLAMLQQAIPASLATARDKPIVVYCNDGVRTGPKATALLQQAGYTQAANMTNGIEGWAAAGHAIAR